MARSLYRGWAATLGAWSAWASRNNPPDARDHRTDRIIDELTVANSVLKKAWASPTNADGSRLDSARSRDLRRRAETSHAEGAGVPRYPHVDMVSAASRGSQTPRPTPTTTRSHPGGGDSALVSLCAAPGIQAHGGGGSTMARPDGVHLKLGLSHHETTWSPADAQATTGGTSTNDAIV